MTVNPILKSLAVNEWGADGIISSDALAVELMVSPRHYYKSHDEGLAEAIKAGIAQVLAFRFAPNQLAKKDVDAHLLAESDIDAVLRGKFRTVIRLGLLDPPAKMPYAKIGAASEPDPWTTDKHKAVALQVARESVVLLKNENAFLPLDRHALKSIAVVGPRAGEVLIDLYGGKPPYAISPLQGIRAKVGAAFAVKTPDTNDAAAAVAAARASDVAIVVVGNHPTCGATNIMAMFNMDVSSKPCADPGEGREGRDRESIDLSQEDLVRQVYAANPKTVVVLISSFPYAINWTQQHVPAILHIAHAAQEQGTAIVDVLFGDYNPAGRLNQTWPKSLDQLPPMMDYDIRHGRTYTYFKGEPLYPFGHGLSYTTFQYANLKYANGTASVDVTNTGSRAGDEVVQFYAKEGGLKHLRNFARVSLQPHETRTVSLPVEAAAGAEVIAGGSSADERVRWAAR